jgi:hypothetical protein
VPILLIFLEEDYKSGVIREIALGWGVGGVSSESKSEQ